VLVFKGTYNAGVLLVYLESSEIIPMILMLKIFEGRKDQNNGVPDGANPAEPSHTRQHHLVATGGGNDHYRAMTYPDGGGIDDGIVTSLHEQLLPSGNSQPTSRTTSAQPHSFGYTPYSSEWTAEDRPPTRPGPTFTARTSMLSNSNSNSVAVSRVDVLPSPTSTSGRYSSNNNTATATTGYRTVYHSDGAPPPSSDGGVGVAPYSASPRHSSGFIIPPSRSIGRDHAAMSHASRLSNADQHTRARAGSNGGSNGRGNNEPSNVGSLGSTSAASVYSQRTDSHSQIIIDAPATAVAPSSSSSHHRGGGSRSGSRRRGDSDANARPTQVVKVYAYQGEPEFRDTSDLFQLDD
jgi:hypothetical protein